MLDPTSRYAKLTIKTRLVPAADADDPPQEVRYLERRILPRDDGAPPQLEHHVIEGDRLDNITARYLGDPTQFWRVADANQILRPEELTDEPGSAISIASPKP